ncbi:MAG: hypothetical protein ACO37Y_12750 [Steroidobacteraceae bacterium]
MLRLPAVRAVVAPLLVLLLSNADAAPPVVKDLPVDASSRAVMRDDLVVYHPATAPPTYLDHGVPGDSVGDVRIFHFTGTTGDGAPVVMDWIMTTTGLDSAELGVESRVTLGVFSFSGQDEDQILLEGVGLYPAADSTFVPNSLLVRPIIGGSGRFKGASGQVTSVHLEDGSWMHAFEFDDQSHLGRSP